MAGKAQARRMGSDVPADGVIEIPGGVVAPLGSVWVRVVVSHDGMLAGQIHEVAYTLRNQSLIMQGYLEMIAPPDGSGWPS